MGPYGPIVFLPFLFCSSLSSLCFPASLESQGAPSVARPLGGANVHRTFA